jgi:hypothetical protein
VLHGFLTLVIALNSLYWFFDPVPIVVSYLGGAGIILWVSYLVSLGRARIELSESAVSVHGPCFQVVHRQQLRWLYGVLLLLAILDLAALVLGPAPVWAQRVILGARIAWLFGYLWCFGVPGGLRRRLRYSEITAAPWERRLTVTSTVLQMEISNSESPFSFPAWLDSAARREIAGRVAARMKHARAAGEATAAP